MDTKRWTLLVAMMGVLLATAFANDNNANDDERAEFKREQWVFFQENIKPKIDAQRTKLESSLTTEDKKEISNLREEIIKQRLMENEFLFEARAARIKGEEFDEGLFLEIEAQRIVIENHQDQAKLIANKYRPEIDDLVADLREELRGDMADRRQSKDGSGYGRRGPENKTGYGNRGNGPGPRGESGDGPGMSRGFDHGMNGRLDITGFLLWDVNRG